MVDDEAKMRSGAPDPFRQTAELLHEQRDWLRVTLSSIGDAVITTDIDGRITFLNAVAEPLTGWMHRDAVGQPLDDVFRIINETSHQPVESPTVRALREGIVVGLANHTLLIGKDGTERPIGPWRTTDSGCGSRAQNRASC